MLAGFIEDLIVVTGGDLLLSTGFNYGVVDTVSSLSSRSWISMTGILN